MKTFDIDSFFTSIMNGIEYGIQSESPVRIKVDHKDELEELFKFCKEKGIRFIDNMEQQLNEYSEIYGLFHQKTQSDFHELVDQTRDQETGLLGNLIYFPWKERCIINLVPEQWHYELITWRNKDKITEDEQERVSQKSIGVVGCSVGSFATRVLAKLGFRKFNIAELKEMKPSNTSRMYHDSVRDYGRHKISPLMEGLYEYNPYIQLNTFQNGLTSSNIDDFFEFEGKQIDVLIDAADDGKIKLLLRDYCREKKIPLVSGFDEKGALIIIRYDDPENLVEDHFDFDESHLDSLKQNDPEEYVNKLLDFFPGGRENLTQRQKDTIEGISKKRRGGFSQLAWEASFFASYVAKAVIDICLEKPIQGKKLLDLDVQISKEMSIKSYKSVG